MTEQENLWLPLVDEPITAIVSEIEAEDPVLLDLVSTPEKLLAFRTFANIRVGIVLEWIRPAQVGRARCDRVGLEINRPPH